MDGSYPQAMSRLAPALLAVLLVIGMATGCRSGIPHTVSPTGPTGPVRDSAPYWCLLIPKDTLWKVTGTTPNSGEQVGYVSAYERSGECRVNAPHVPAPLRLRVVYGEYAQQLAARDGSGGTVLPTSLGRARQWPADFDGEAATALFRCGSQTYWISVTFTPFPSGRDLKTDLTEVLTITEGRWASLVGCRLNTTAPLPTIVPYRPTATAPTLSTAR